MVLGRVHEMGYGMESVMYRSIHCCPHLVEEDVGLIWESVEVLRQMQREEERRETRWTRVYQRCYVRGCGNYRSHYLHRWRLRTSHLA